MLQGHKNSGKSSPSNYTLTGPPPLVALEIFVSGPETGLAGGSGFSLLVLFSTELAADEFLFVIVTVISVAPSPSGGLFATGSGDMRARIWRSVLSWCLHLPTISFLFSPLGPDRIILFLSCYSLFLISFFALLYPTKRGGWYP